MPYIIFKSDGTILATVGDASLDTTTDLQLVGRNYSGYGQVVNENFVKLLENFANTTPPTKPLIGQIWYDITHGRLNVNYDGENFKSVANIYIGEVTRPPNNATTKEGDLWWDTTNGQLKAKRGSSYVLIGPPNASNSKSAWVPTEELSQENQLQYTPFLKATIGSDNIITISENEFTPVAGSTLSGSFLRIYKGVTLAYTDETGSSQNSRYYYWGTASDALKSNTSTTATYAMSVYVDPSATTDSRNYYIPFISTVSGANHFKSTSTFYITPSTNVVNTVATAARYSDLAERYEADSYYDEGTVLIVGGEKEVTSTNIHGHPSVAGIVSRNPAYMMNSEAGDNETHPYIALKGRVPCKVAGKVQKGDRLITSRYPGYATVDDNTPNAGIVGIALENHEVGFGLIEVKV